MKHALVMHAGAELSKDSTVEERLERMMKIADDIVGFCHRVGARRVFIEDHAFGLASTANANQTIEMTGIVKAAVKLSIGCAPIPIHSAKARSILLQKLPRKGAKDFAQRNVKRLKGVTTWTEDEIDAFVVANAGIMLSGGVAMSFPGK